MSSIERSREKDDVEDQERHHDVRVFISYAQEDKKLHEKLVKHLSPLKHLGMTIFHNQEILPGDNWEDQINDQLSGANVILLLVSVDFLDSEYCQNEEVKKAFDRHQNGEVRVIPVILRPAGWQYTPLAALQHLPTGTKPVTEWENQDAAFENIVHGIKKTLEQESPFQKIAKSVRSVFPKISIQVSWRN